MPNLPPIPPEAIEAALRGVSETLYDGAEINPDSLVGKSILTALRAALPFLPQHVSPSAEAVARTWWRGMYGVEAPATFDPGEPGTVEAYNASLWTDYLRSAERVLALFSSAPSVVQTRRRR